MTLINIRPATKEDLPSILEILNHAIVNTTAVYNYHPYTVEMIEEWYAEKIANNAPVFVSTHQHIVTGYVTYGPYRTRPAYKYTKEHSIYVHPNYRRQGIAKQLMHTIIQAAKQADIHSLIGGIDEENQISIAFHKEFGFVEVGNLKQVGFKFGRWLNLVFVQLILETPLHPSDDL